jgi:hypothetical protein
MAFTSLKELVELAAEIVASKKPVQDGLAAAQNERAEPEREAPLKRAEQDLRSTRDPAVNAVYVAVIRDREHNDDPILLDEIQVTQDVPDEYIQLCIATFRGLLEAEIEAAGGRRRALQQPEVDKSQ